MLLKASLAKHLADGTEVPASSGHTSSRRGETKGALSTPGQGWARREPRTRGAERGHLVVRAKQGWEEGLVG